MIAKINRSSNLYGALKYNMDKVAAKNAEVLYTSRIIENGSGNFSMSDLMRSFEPYLIANQNTEKTTLHISLNPDPKDVLNNDTYAKIANDYMVEMGYGDQPYVVYKHTDIERTHLHIVTIGVDELGRKISDSYEKVRSTKLCRTLEKDYGLQVATDKESVKNERIFHPVDYKKGDIKSQMSSVIRHLPKYYQFQSLGEYNALLSLFNIAAEKVVAINGGIDRQGLIYSALDELGKKTGLPIKASIFGKQAGLAALQIHFDKSQQDFKSGDIRNQLKKSVHDVLLKCKDERSFKKKLSEIGINLVVRRNEEGRIYGITFIDHKSKAVCKGSRLGKDFSANSYNDLWSQVGKDHSIRHVPSNAHDLKDDKVLDKMPHPLFSFINNVSGDGESSSYGLGSILPSDQSDDYEELAFENYIKKRRKKRKKK